MSKRNIPVVNLEHFINGEPAERADFVAELLRSTDAADALRNLVVIVRVPAPPAWVEKWKTLVAPAKVKELSEATLISTLTEVVCF